ncbi:hypothetical protein GAY28_37350, partial [Azospirillum brasilense]|nr:hypothetical protein [Azospirillum brasilense]
MAMPSDPPFHDRPDALPPEPGAYVLLIALDGALTLRLPGKPESVLAPGRYLYCGSARGPGLPPLTFPG